MTEYKEMIEVLEQLKYENQLAIDLTLKRTRGKDKYQKWIEALSKAITLAKLHQEVSSELPEKREMIEHICIGNHGCRACHIAGGNKALDLCKPLIVKRDMLIKALKEKIGELEARDTINAISFRNLAVENSKLKEEIEELKKTLEAFKEDGLGKNRKYFKLQSAYMKRYEEKHKLQQENTTLRECHTCPSITEHPKYCIECYSKLEKENIALKDKLSEERIVKILQDACISSGYVEDSEADKNAFPEIAKAIKGGKE